MLLALPPSRRFHVSANFTFPGASKRSQVGRRKDGAQLEDGGEDVTFPEIRLNYLRSQRHLPLLCEAGRGVRRKARIYLGDGRGCRKVVEKENQLGR